MKQVYFHIQSVPIYTPPGHPIYVAGNFNGWKTGDEKFMLSKNPDGTWFLEFETELSEIEFRCNRGGWDVAEGDESAKPNPVRKFVLSEGRNIIPVHISSWIDFAEQHFKHSVSPNVLVIDHAFYIPQLNRTRKITAYLPPDYFTTQKRYPVLYMQDGQNIFDSWQTISDEWNADESLDRLYFEEKKSIIVIGIDHGGEKRIDEYAPFVNEEEGGGEGSAYTDFIVQTLKPFIDNNYRTLPQRENTAVMGSSMGGLISLYTAVKFQEIFGIAAVFSPSLWFTDDIYKFIRHRGSLMPQTIFLLAGGKESGTMTTDILKLYFTLANAGFSESSLYLDICREGTHSEWFWGKEFPVTLNKMYFNNLSISGASGTNSPVSIFYNRQTEYLEITIDQRVSRPVVRIYDNESRLISCRALFYCRNYIKIREGIQNLQVELYNDDSLFYNASIPAAEDLQMTG